MNDSSWYKALTLNERLALARRPCSTDNWTEDTRRKASRRLDAWKSQIPSSSSLDFSERLSMFGTNEQELLLLLGESDDQIRLRATTSPTWINLIEEVFASNDGFLEYDDSVEAFGFQIAVLPLIVEAVRSLRSGMQQALNNTYLNNTPFDVMEIEQCFLSSLMPRLAAIMDRTMVLELQVANLQGHLSGESPRERFVSFLRYLNNSDTALGILKEYPVMARQVIVCLNNWTEASLELIQRLASNWSILQATFDLGEASCKVVSITMGAGDSHRRGRTVALLEFANGCKLVYKPRSLQIEVHFQCLLEWLNGRGPQLALRTTKVLDRGSYGWCEFVQRETCSSIDELARFYTRQGEFLALLYMLEATDFHYENLIAAGEHPVLIDLESLFHPRSKQTRPKSRDVSGGTDDDQSVLRIGLLPLRLWNTDEHEGVDLSGLGSVEGQFTPREVIGWDGFGTDIMKVVRKRTEMAGGENRPLLNGNDVNTVEYVDAMVDGFTTTYEAILTHRETLLSKEGPLSWFLNDEVRFIFRPTLSYSLLLRESFHPDLLRDALYRDRFLDKIWNGMEGRHHQREIISAELADIHNNDVPMLTTRPNSRDLNTTSGETIRDFFEESGMNAVRRRLWNMNAEDLAAQVAVIRNSLSTLKGHGTGLKGLDTK